MTETTQRSAAASLMAGNQTKPKKRPSIYAISMQDEDEKFDQMREDTEPNEEQGVSFNAFKRPSNHLQRRNATFGPEDNAKPRSDSYIGRLKSFLGFNQGPAEQEESKSQLTNLRAQNSRQQLFGEAALGQDR